MQSHEVQALLLLDNAPAHSDINNLKSADRTLNLYGFTTECHLSYPIYGQNIIIYIKITI